MDRFELLRAEEVGAASGWVSPLSQEDRDYFAYSSATTSPRPRRHDWNMTSLSAWRKVNSISRKQTPDTVREGTRHGIPASPDRAA